MNEGKIAMSHLKKIDNTTNLKFSKKALTLTCQLCDHRWKRRTKAELPQQYPKCKRYDWNLKKSIQKESKLISKS